MERILTTHTGSLVAPARPARLPRRRGARRVRTTRRPTSRHSPTPSTTWCGARPRPGIDVVDDGEMGKSTWITYLYERVSGLEPRMVPLEGGNILPPSRDRQAFPEFYAEHDAAFAREVENQVRVKGHDGPSGGRDRGRGKALVLHRADRVRPLRARARHRPLQERARRRRGGRRVPPRRRAGERLLAAQRVLRERGGVRLRRRRRAPRGVPAHRRRGLPAPGRRRGAPARVRLDPLARRLGRRLPALGGAAGRGPQPRAHGHPGGAHPLPRLLRQLARPARLRPAARRRDRPRARVRRATT